jgi:hypothetical protein
MLACRRARHAPRAVQEEQTSAPRLGDVSAAILARAAAAVSRAGEWRPTLEGSPAAALLPPADAAMTGAAPNFGSLYRFIPLARGASSRLPRAVPRRVPAKAEPAEHADLAELAELLTRLAGDVRTGHERGSVRTAGAALAAMAALLAHFATSLSPVRPPLCDAPCGCCHSFVQSFDCSARALLVNARARYIVISRILSLQEQGCSACFSQALMTA